MSKPDVSIIIRTLNEERYLPELLSSIQGQRSSFTHEVVLIDSGSTDSTLTIAQRFGCRILHISRADFSFGRSLNRACEESRGIYFVLISGHCIPCNQHWLQNLVQPLAEGLVQYSYGRQVGGAQTYWSECQIFSKYFPEVSSIPQEGFYCNNANSAINRQSWKLYRFDEELTGLEDMHLAKRLVGSGGAIGYAADACVYHLHHEKWGQIKRRFEREALALQQICPEVTIRRRDALKYYIRAVIKDIATSNLKLFRLPHFFNIFAYRYFQYVGSYTGGDIHKRVSKQLRDSYFYPTYSKGNPLTSK